MHTHFPLRSAVEKFKYKISHNALRSIFHLQRQKIQKLHQPFLMFLFIRIKKKNWIENLSDFKNNHLDVYFYTHLFAHTYFFNINKIFKTIHVNMVIF